MLAAEMASFEAQRYRIYLEDTDAGGIVYHASYVRFTERARTEWLRNLGMQQSETFAHDTSFVVHSMKLRFMRPARLDDIIEVSCDVTKVRAASITFAQEVRVADGGDLCCHADVRVACISLATGRPQKVPPDLLARLA
jgi:tol-pal system-associated acyl-CoA thioesterase